MSPDVLTQAADFRDESEALDQLVAPLDDAALQQVTGFKGWTIEQIIAHLYHWTWAVELSITDEVAFLAHLRDFGARKAALGMRALEREWLDGLAGRALVDQWRAGYRQTAERFLAIDPKRRLKWAGPDMSARSSMTARQMETWAHGQAVFDRLGATRIDTDRIRNIVVLGINTFGWTFKVHGRDVPEAPPQVELTAPTGARWVYHEGSGSGRIRGTATEFCQVVTQVRHRDDTALRIEGDVAGQWMSIAQCFAGPPETPPAPGTRRVIRG
ncbi:MAG: TIGR03084 family metal-binding protein [Burkholderiaceae bacterium]